MTSDMTNRISSADWGERSRILTNHLKGLILQGEWQPGQKLPSARQLAETYGISIETVRRHVHNIYEKLHVRSRTDAVNKYFNR